MTNLQLLLDNTNPVEELVFEQLAPSYKSVHMAGAVAGYLLLGALALFLLLLDNSWWCVAAECLIFVVCVLNVALIPAAYHRKGYALREKDISYRSGILFPKTTTIPFNRIQQVSVEQNPASKFFGLYSVVIVNGAQALSSMTVPGLPEHTANQIKSLIINKLKNV